MKENIKRLLLIFSVVLNIAFVGTYAGVVAFSGGSCPGRTEESLMSQLHLNAEQEKQLSEDRQKVFADLEELGRTTKVKQLELIDLVSAQDPDLHSIEAKRKEIRELQAAVQDRVMVHLLEIDKHAQLSPEQRTQFFGLMKQRAESGTLRCPRCALGLGAGH